MTNKPSPLQSQLLALAHTIELSAYTLRQLGDFLGGKHPYSVQQALDGLVKKGHLVRNEKTGEIYVPQANNSTGVPFLNIPVLGGVSCGVATMLAYDNPGTITVSPSVVSLRRPELSYALVADGDSMTAASISGKAVNSGDYVIVEKADMASIKTNDYVVSRLGETSNLKRILIDKANERIILLSESKHEFEYPPIIIAEEDMEYFQIEGKAIDVVKGIK